MNKLEIDYPNVTFVYMTGHTFWNMMAEIIYRLLEGITDKESAELV